MPYIHAAESTKGEVGWVEACAGLGGAGAWLGKGSGALAGGRGAGPPAAGAGAAGDPNGRLWSGLHGANGFQLVL